MLQSIYGRFLLTLCIHRTDMPLIRINVCCFCAVLGFLNTAGAAELRVVGFHHNTLALARVDSAAVAAGDVYVVLEFEDRWFREIGRARVTKLLQNGVVAEIISSPKPPSEWYNKIAIPETAWDADTYQQWQRSSGRTGSLPRIGAGGRPDADPARPLVHGSHPAAGTPQARLAGSTRPLIWDRMGWVKWMMYGIGAGSGAAAFYLHRQAQDARDAVSPGNPPGVNAHYQRDADEYQKLRNVTGWVSLGTLAGGLVLHEWELADRSRRQPATARLESQWSAGLATVGCHVQW
jgi:hypothetical protein